VIEGPALIPADPAAFVDGIHPNNAGMAVLARNLAPALARIMGG
jgi:lysophospholipase L1-like esterase